MRPLGSQGPGPAGPEELSPKLSLRALAQRKNRAPRSNSKTTRRLREAARRRSKPRRPPRNRQTACLSHEARAEEATASGNRRELGSATPDEVVNVRQKTITDLQEAYANGFQKEVFELLSRFGNGARASGRLAAGELRVRSGGHRQRRP